MHNSDNYWKCRELYGELAADFIWWMKSMITSIPLFILMTIFACFMTIGIAVSVMTIFSLLQLLIDTL